MADPDFAPDIPTDDGSLAAGTMLCDGQFVITRQIGAGGFGITYSAEDTVLGRTIVIKECFPEDFCHRIGVNVLPRNQTQSKQFRSIVDMFMHEARSLAKMRHPHIVGVHRAFEENNTAYMVLDMIEGENLLDVLEMNGQMLTPDVVEALLLDLLDALQKVHEIDLLHRDISPDNIMIDSAGTAVLIDFGAARGDASRKTRAISSLLVVKDGYSPQEFYVAGSIQTPSSDLYALGATFYHLITGEAPPNSQARMVEIAGQKPDPCIPLVERARGYPMAFLSAIDSAMKILPKERLQSVGEWRSILDGATPVAVSEPSAQAVTRLLHKPQPTPTPKPKSATPSRPELKKSLSALVEETNDVVSKSRAVVVEQPKEEVAAKPVSKIPDWVAEFNRETTGGIPVDDVSDVDEGLGVVLTDPADMSTDQPALAKRVRTPRPSSAPTSEGRSSGWALDAIAAREKSRAIPTLSEPHIVVKTTPHTPRQIITPADIAAEEAALQAGVVTNGNPSLMKAISRMALMGMLFGLIVYVGTSAVIAG